VPKSNSTCSKISVIDDIVAVHIARAVKREFQIRKALRTNLNRVSPNGQIIANLDAYIVDATAGNALREPTVGV
jgi:hypothetical protein